jgi:hypothetical protein
VEIAAEVEKYKTDSRERIEMAKLQVQPFMQGLEHEDDIELERVKGDERIELERVKNTQ